MTDDNLQKEAGYRIPDSELTPEELVKRKEFELRQQKEKSYDNSFEKYFAEGIGQVKLRQVTENTDFTNLKVTKLDWNFWMKGEPYVVVRVPGYPHQYDNEYYCYPQINEHLPYSKKLIPFDEDWRESLGNLKMEIYSNPWYKIKWDEYRTRFEFIGKLTFDTDILLAKSSGRNWGECFSSLQCSVNTLRCHSICFVNRNWRDEVIGRKIWYRESPAIVEKICDYYGSDSILSFYIKPQKEKLDCPKNWDEDSNGICNKQNWEENYSFGVVAQWDCQYIDWNRQN